VNRLSGFGLAARLTPQGVKKARPRTNALPESLNEKARELVRAILTNGLRGTTYTQEQLADIIDFSQSGISAMVNPKSIRGVSVSTAKKLWDLAGEDFDADLDAAMGGVRGASARDPQALLDDSVDPFERAAMMARNNGFSEKAIAQAEQMRAFTGQLDMLDFFKAIMRAEKEGRGAVTAVEVVHDDSGDPAERMAKVAKRKRRS
jgi:hypothetical protein